MRVMMKEARNAALCFDPCEDDSFYMVETETLFLSDEGPMLETLDYTIRIGSTPTLLFVSLLCLRTCIHCTQHTTFSFYMD